MDPVAKNSSRCRHACRTGAQLSADLSLVTPGHGENGFVDPPLLLGAHMAYEITEPRHVDGTQLLDKYSRHLTPNRYLRSKRRGTSAL